MEFKIQINYLTNASTNKLNNKTNTPKNYLTTEREYSYKTKYIFKRGDK